MEYSNVYNLTDLSLDQVLQNCVLPKSRNYKLHKASAIIVGRSVIKQNDLPIQNKLLKSIFKYGNDNDGGNNNILSGINRKDISYKEQQCVPLDGDCDNSYSSASGIYLIDRNTKKIHPQKYKR